VQAEREADDVEAGANVGRGRRHLDLEPARSRRAGPAAAAAATGGGGVGHGELELEVMVGRVRTRGLTREEAGSSLRARQPSPAASRRAPGGGRTKSCRCKLGPSSLDACWLAGLPRSRTLARRLVDTHTASSTSSSSSCLPFAAPSRLSAMSGRNQRVMVQPINIIFKHLQSVRPLSPLAQACFALLGRAPGARRLPRLATAATAAASGCRASRLKLEVVRDTSPQHGVRRGRPG
jgi:hypothetical protein